MRNLILISIILSGLLWIHLLNFKVPAREDLLVANGEVKEIEPILKSGSLNGYKLTLGQHLYVMSWVDFSINESRLNRITNKKNVYVSYRKSFFGMSNKVFEISIGEEIIFSYDFFVSNYSRSERKKLAAMPYLLTFCLFCLALHQFLAHKNKQAVQKVK